MAGLLAIAWRRGLVPSHLLACSLAPWFVRYVSLSFSLARSPSRALGCPPSLGCVVKRRLANAKSVQNLLAEILEAMLADGVLYVVPVPHFKGVCEFDVPLFFSIPTRQWELLSNVCVLDFRAGCAGRHKPALSKKAEFS